MKAGEFAAVRSVGFEPIGQVFGAVVYPLSAWPSCASTPVRRFPTR